MGRKRRTVITIESHQLTVVRSRRTSEMWCQECGKQLPTITAEAAAALAGINTGAICDGIESGELHSVETRRRGAHLLQLVLKMVRSRSSRKVS